MKPKKAILLYNPYSGHRNIVNALDSIIEKLEESDYEVRLFRSKGAGSIRQHIIDRVTASNTQLVLIAGGDGTLNECVSGMMNKKLDIPLLILPVGTSNDFANSAHVPMEVEEALNLLEIGELTAVDVGKANEKYFINVCNMGLLSSVSHTVDQELKKKFGRFAYYIKGIEEVQNLTAMELSLITEKERLEGKYLLVLIFNGNGAGGLMKLAKHAKIYDGKFDVVCIKDLNIFAVPALFFKVLQGEHLNDANIDYLTCEQLRIECYNQEEKEFVTDVDGERGPTFPIEVKVLPKRIRVYLPKEN